LEIWEARRIDRIVEAGRTFPLVVDCVGPHSANGGRRLFIVKAMGLPEISQTSLFFEAFGNLLARKLSVNTPEPVLIELTPPFVAASNAVLGAHPELSGRGAQLIAGQGAGAEYLAPGFTPIVPGAHLSDNDLPMAARIYAYDLMVQNPDRSFQGERKPNCAYFENRLVAYDFELCFSFARLIGVREKAWEISKHGIYNRHVFFTQLCDASRLGKVDFGPVIKGIAALEANELAQMIQSFPPGWPQFASKIEQHLAEVVANLPAFELELYRSLA
jgi:hypothetical protein